MIELTPSHVRAVETARSQLDMYGFAVVRSVVDECGVSEEIARWALMEMCTPPEGDDESDSVATYECRVRVGFPESETWRARCTPLARRIPLGMLRYLDPDKVEKIHAEQRERAAEKRRKERERRLRMKGKKRARWTTRRS